MDEESYSWSASWQIRAESEIHPEEDSFLDYDLGNVILNLIQNQLDPDFRQDDDNYSYLFAKKSSRFYLCVRHDN